MKSSKSVAASGYNTKMVSAGENISMASSGEESKLYSEGNDSRMVSSGNGSKLVSYGPRSVVCAIGEGGIAKAAAGSWITLAEYNHGSVVCVKTEYVDGERIKENTFYKLKDGRFTEVEED